jgi:OOP family OmpA-OmpF porin
MTRIRTLLLSCAALVVLAAPAAAENRANTLTVSPMVGGFIWDGAFRRNVNGQATQLNNSLAAGIRVGYNITSMLGIEGFYDYLPTSYDGTNKPDVWGQRFGGDLLLHFMPEKSFVPYLAGGYGALALYQAGHANNHTYWVPDYGLGFKYFVNDNVAVRVDSRVVNIFEHGTWFNYAFNAGVTMNFPPKKKAPAPAPPPPPPAKVEPAPTVSLTAEPSTVAPGKQSKLTWTSQNASDCKVDATDAVLDTKVTTQGSVYVTPTETRTYTMTCTGPGGSASSSATVTIVAPPKVEVPKPSCTISAFPTKIVEGEQVKLSWTSQNATKVTVEPPLAPVATEGSVEFSPKATTTYKVTCTNDSGSSTNTTTVTVNPALVEEKKSITLMIEFDFDKFDIKPKYHDDIKKVADFMTDYPKTTAVINGYTDSKGTDKYNQKLSERRANAVMNYLVEKLGIDKSRLSAKGHGEANPVASNKTEEGRQKNRRIESVIDTRVYVKKK